MSVAGPPPQVMVGLAPLFQLTGTVGFATLLPSLRCTYLF